MEFVEVDKRNLFKMESLESIEKMESITDTHWSRQWGMRRSGFESAWSRLNSYDFAADPVTVAVLDTGVELDHEDLHDRLWQNPGEIPGNGTVPATSMCVHLDLLDALIQFDSDNLDILCQASLPSPRH